MNRVLSVPELLGLIFGSSDRRSNVNNSLVCKTWSGPALDHIWREVDKVEGLFRLLGNLCLVQENTGQTTNIARFVSLLSKAFYFNR
jgi:hypothetical protein